MTISLESARSRLPRRDLAGVHGVREALRQDEDHRVVKTAHPESRPLRPVDAMVEGADTQASTKSRAIDQDGDDLPGRSGFQEQGR